MLYLIGIGLADEKDITLKGLEALRACDKIYMENYTSLLQVPFERLEEFYEKKIIISPRNTFENESAALVNEAKDKDVAVLVIGDALSATTHISLLMEAKEKGVASKVIHNASVLTAVGATGLQLYKFGRTASIPYHESVAPYEILELNQKAGLHSLFLLDLSPKDGQFMSASKAAEILLNIEEKEKKKLISPITTAIAAIRLGSDSQKIISGPLSKIKASEFGPGPHCLIIPGDLHFMEEQALKELKDD